MEDLTQQIIDYLSSGQSVPGMLILFASSFIEYVFPPFPGDTVTLFGAFLAANFEWSVPIVFAVVTLGSLAGSAADYGLGRRLAHTPVEQLSGRKKKAREKVQPILEKFEQHGAVYVVINRFLPGVRAFFFIAAGMARLPLWKVLLWGAVSAVAWNSLIIAVGFAIGKNWDRLLGLLRTYTTGAYVLIGVVIVVLVVRWIIKRRKT
jgi:membrane protein DedA with SNARE-associated domain